MQKAIPYYRVSTERQGISGLGLEAQQQAVLDFAKKHDYELVLEFCEIESGKKNNRPMLIAALNECRKCKAILLIAKLDRLGRNVAFISKLMESGVDFTAVDMPNAHKIVLHILASVAEYERDMTSRRTKEALAAAKRRGIQLGVNGRDVLSKQNSENAKQFARDMTPIISNLRQEGFTSVRDITFRLNQDGVQTYRGRNSKWHVNSVHTLLKRIEKLKP